MTTSAMPWIKLYTEMLDDPKLGRLDDADKWRFVQLCLLAGECDANGALVNGDEPLTVADIAWRLRVAPEALILSLDQMNLLGVIQLEDEAFVVTNFGKRQGRPQAERRELWRDRQQRHRVTQEDVTRDSRVTHAPRVEKSREEGEGEGEGEGETAAAAAPCPAAPVAKVGMATPKPAPKPSKAGPETTEPTNGTEHRAMFDALVGVLCLDALLLTAEQRGRINALSKQIRDSGHSVEAVARAGEWWREQDWRGKKGDSPTNAQLFEAIAKAKARARPPTDDHERDKARRIASADVLGINY